MLTEQDREEEYEVLRPEMSRRRKIMVVALGVFIVFALLAGLLSFWAYRQLFPSSRPGPEIVLDVPSGSSTSSIADLLEKKNVISNAFLFKLYVKAKSGGPFLAGTYRMPLHDTASDVLRRLKAGPLPPPTRRFTVTPGLNLRQIPAQIVTNIPTFSVDKLNAVLAAGQVRSQFQPPDKSIEGFLFPDTYEIGEGADETAAIQAMVTQFDKVATELGLPEAQALVGRDPYEVLIVASLVEEEAKVDVDRPKIAQVIYNRLRQGMPLGVDATLCYVHEERPCVLHQSDLTRRPLQLPPQYRLAAHPDRQRESQGARGRAASGERRRDLLRARPQPARGPALLHRERERVRGGQSAVQGRRPRLRLGALVAVSGTTRLAAVIGAPIRHSLSPAIFNAGFEACELDWVYLAFEVPPGHAGRRARRDARPRHRWAVGDDAAQGCGRGARRSLLT